MRTFSRRPSSCLCKYIRNFKVIVLENLLSTLLTRLRINSYFLLQWWVNCTNLQLYDWKIWSSWTSWKVNYSYFVWKLFRSCQIDWLSSYTWSFCWMFGYYWLAHTSSKFRIQVKSIWRVSFNTNWSLACFEVNK